MVTPNDPKSSNPTADRSFDPLAEPTSPIEVPTTIGPYRLLEPIGEGGMGVVYLAEQTEPVRRRVAIKLIKPGMDSARVVARFEAERQALALMDHPNIAKVLDAGATDRGLPYFVMDHVKGVPISTHCDRHKLSIRDRLDLFIRVCDAVQHAHAKAVIHRDLKPSNILVEYHDGRSVPKIIDFGVAKALNQPLTEKTLFTHQGQLIGTPEYMCPEQAESSGQDIDTRADVYSLGVVLYELLTGALPFDAQSLRSAGVAEIHRIIREVDPPKPSLRLSTSARARGRTPTPPLPVDDEAPTQPEVPPTDSPPARPQPTTGVSDPDGVARDRRTTVHSLTRSLRNDLDWVVMKCLEKDRTRRYLTPNALAEDIRRFLANKPLSAGPPSVTYRVRKFTRRHRTAVVIGAIIALSALGALATISTAYLLLEEKQAALEQAHDETTAVNEFLVYGVLRKAAPGEGRPGPQATIVEVIVAAAEDYLQRRDSLSPDSQLALNHTLSQVFFLVNQPELGLPFAEDTLELLREHTPDDQPAIMRAISDVANFLQRLGREQEAVELLISVHSQQSALLGPRHPETLRTLANLLTPLRRLKRFEELDRYSAELLAGRRAVLGADHEDTIRAMSARVGVLRKLDRSAEALPIARLAHETARRTRAEDDPITLNLLNNLARVLIELGELDEAEAILRDGLAAAERTFAPGDRPITAFLWTLARMLNAQGRFDEARSLLIRARENRIEHYGEEHEFVQNIDKMLSIIDAASETPPDE